MMGEKGLLSKLENLKVDKLGVVQSLLTGMGWRVKLDGTSPLVFICANVLSTVAVHLLFVLTAAGLLDCTDRQTH
jgi:hypothetical protein